MPPPKKSNTRTPVADWRNDYDRLCVRIADYIRLDPANSSEENFNRLALDIFAFQTRHNRAYANFSRALNNGSLPSPSSWREIPALPAEAFRFPDSPITCFPPAKAALSFETSGTSSATRGTHHLLSPSLYRASILAGWRQCGLPELPVAILTPPPSLAPRSSLSFMMQTLADAFGHAPAPASAPFLVSSENEIHLPALEARCQRGEPFLLLGTAIAFLHLFELLDNRTLALPPGSWAMETGGYKGTRRQLSKNDLYNLFQKYLALSPDQIINEYGMTELSSQFYSTGLNRPHHGPHWTRARVLDPASGLEAPHNQTGALVLTDLANLGSCTTIATRDLAVRHHDSFTLLGRNPNADDRGCSLAADEWLSSQ